MSPFHRFPSPFTGQPKYQSTAKPSFRAMNERRGIYLKDGIAALLIGAVDRVVGVNVFPLAGGVK